MADFTMDDFKGAVEYDALTKEATKVPVSESALRQQAIKQYEPTHAALNDSYNKQLLGLMTSRAADDKTLREQFELSVGNMSATLQKRGFDFNATSLGQSAYSALQKDYNELKNDHSIVFDAQRKSIESQKDLLTANYEKAIKQRMATNRYTNIKTLSEILEQLSKLMVSAENEYAQLTAGGGGGGGGRRSYGGRGGTTTPTQDDANKPGVISSILSGGKPYVYTGAKTSSANSWFIAGTAGTKSSSRTTTATTKKTSHVRKGKR